MRLLVVLVPSLVLAACSSSSEPAGWPFERRPVDEAARTAAMRAIGARVDEIAANGQSRAAQNASIAEYLRTAPEVAIAAESVDGAVAYSYDGQALDSFESMLFPPNPTNDLGRVLEDRKYSKTTFDATVAHLAAVSGDGVVHIRTHGGGGCFDNRGGPRQRPRPPPRPRSCRRRRSCMPTLGR